MIHGINTHHRIESLIIKRQPLIHIHQLESSFCDFGIKSMLACHLDSFFIDIQSCNATLELLDEIERGPAGAAGYLKDMVARVEIEPAIERVIFIGCNPTVLTDILPIGFLSHGS